MSASRADRAGSVRPGRRAAPAAILIPPILIPLGALLLASAAHAQSQGPIRLGPPAADTARSVTVPVVPAGPDTPIILVPPPARPDAAPSPPPVADPITPAPAKPGTIQAAPLAAPDPDGAGVLDASNGGLGVLLWHGVPRGAVLRLLSELPLSVPSPTARSLMRRLLLTDAAAPPPAMDEGPPVRRFGALRVEALAGLGDPKGALDLAARLPGVLEDESAARAVVDAQLLQGTLDCPWAVETGKPFPTTYWQRLDLYCRARGGDRTGAALVLELLGGQNDADDSFRALAEAAIAGGVPPLRGLKDPAPLTLAMMRLISAPVSPDLLDLDPMRLAGVARLPSADPTTRVAAAERAATALYMDARALSEAYRAAPAKGDELYRLKDLAARDRGARVRGLVQQAFAGAADGNRRMALAAQAIDLLDPPMWAGPAGTVVAAMFDTVTVNVEAAPLAPAAVRLYEAQGRTEQVRRWRDLATRTGAGARLWPLAAAANPAAGGLSAWLDDALRGGDPSAPARAAGTLALLKALGADVPEEASRRVPADPPALPGEPMRWSQLDMAVKEGRVGETALLALVLLGEAGPAGTPPAVLARLAGALRTVGLENDARALAREAIVAQGL
ncbi:hypothetical protein [Azospirillum sp.]|uniref:hypothetical protein n=1 Tax=Azospirillum sp. TaxID=34012 RepID=UPI003D72D310